MKHNMDKKMMGKGSQAMQAKKDVLMSLKKLAQEMITGELGGDEEGPKGVMAEVKVKKVSPEDIMSKLQGEDSDESDLSEESKQEEGYELSEKDPEDCSVEELDAKIKELEDIRKKKLSSV